MKIKDVAKVLRKANELIIEKDKKDRWLISDSLILLFFDDKEFNEFKEKWNSYKSTTNIELDDSNEFYLLNNKVKSNPNVSLRKIIPDYSDDNVKVKKTKIELNDNTILKSFHNDVIVAETKYIKLIKKNWDIYTKESRHKAPLFIFDDKGEEKILLTQVIKKQVEENLNCTISIDKKTKQIDIAV